MTTLLDAPINVELGNHSRQRAIDGKPAVTYTHIPAAYTYEPGLSGTELRAHLEEKSRNPSGGRAITSLPDHEAAIAITHPHDGAWCHQSILGLGGTHRPAWVWADNEDFARCLGEFWGCQVGRPADYHDTYWRRIGGRDLAPGVPPGAVGVQALTNVGRGAWASSMGGATTGASGTGTAATSTSLTTAANYSVGQFVGTSRIYVFTGTNLVWGNVIGCTAGPNSVITVDQWYAVPETGAAGTTPASGYQYIIPSGGAPSPWYVGISTTNFTPSPTDTSLSGESVVSGMSRKIGVYTLTSATTPAGFTITAVYTLGTAGLLTFYVMGGFNSALLSNVTDSIVYEDAFSAPFSVQHVNDQATVTLSVAGS